MKVKTKVISAVIIAVAVLFTVGFRAAASGYIEYTDLIYTVEESDGIFKLTCGEDTSEGEDLSSLLSAVPNGASVFFSDIENNSTLEISGNKKIFGSLTQSSASVILSGDITLGAEIKLIDSSVTVKSGSVTVEGGSITALGASAFILDRYADAKLIVDSGKISSDHASGTINQRVGTVFINGGEISSFVSSAVVTASSLYLSGAPVFSSVSADISTERAIHLSADGKYFSGAVKVKVEREFERGEFYPILLSANEGQSSSVKLIDKSGLEKKLTFYSSSKYTEEKDFFAVFDANEAKFFIDGALYSTVTFAKGESVAEPPKPKRTGYIFKGWYSDSAYENKYAFGVLGSESLNLYALFSLMPPTFEVNSLSFVYDGKDHPLGFSSLSHPLSDIGSFSYLWYKNGGEASYSSKTVNIRSVLDSGDYYCKLIFSYNGDFVTVTTPTVTVKVDKYTVDIPAVEDLIYNGEEQKISAPASPFYTAEELFGRDAGEYFLKLHLTDTDNLSWRGSSTESTALTVRITKAENAFLAPPEIRDFYEGQLPQYNAAALFGEVTLSFSSDGLTFDSSIPMKPGKYYAKFSVVGTDNYSALTSEILAFSVISEKCIGLRAEGTLLKSSYYAFEKLTLDGVDIIADYNSGRSKYLDKSEIFIEYKTGECLLVTDTCAIIRYGDASLPISVFVLPIEYDISSISFSDKTAVYDGTRHTVTAFGEVIGKDGVALLYSAIGGGIEAGEYSVTLVFSTESLNYLVPAPISAKLVISPMPIAAVYSDTEFVYDGNPKLPSATAIGASGVPFRLSLIGAGCYAGEYTAEVVLTDKNYTVTNPTVTFVIKKAVIDLSGALWSAGEFIYDGNQHSVTVGNLPKEVSIVGYTDASFSEAGDYIAVAKLSYDAENYETPSPLTFSWQIKKALYDTSSFEFIDKNAVYDGNTHYPDLVGKMPVGIDGIALKFSFSSGARRVCEGKVAVTVSFSTDSGNYTAPESITAYVTVSPMNIEVSWLNTDFLYDGKAHIPIATTDLCSLTVRGEGIDAGEYTAVCETENTDYRITNGKITFTVRKAENEWIKLPSVGDIFESGTPSPEAMPKSGEAEFTFYKDAELSEEALLPLSAGTYYLTAFVPESKNYTALYSDAVKFTVTAVMPISILAEPVADIVAYGTLGEFNLKVYYLNNDGTRCEIPFSDIEIDYGEEGKLLSGERAVVLRAGGIEQTVYLSVAKASFDTSGVHWSEEKLTYNGEMQSVHLVGLPDGLSVEYITSGGIYAGEYILSAVAIYDKENYNEPSLPTLTLVISKMTVEIPTEEVFVYNGKVKIPTFVGNDFCEASYPEIKNAGRYTVEYTLFDEKNYALSGDGKTVITVLKAPLTVEVTGNDSFKIIEGELAEGDILSGEFYKDGGYIHFRADSLNYSIEVIPLKRSTVGALLWLFLILAIILSALFVGAWFYIKRNEAVSELAENESHPEMRAPLPTDTNSEIGAELTTLMAVDESHANDLITDSLARSLINEVGETVYTSGYKKCIVGLDALCSAFTPEDRIDINSMKKRGLISPEARYIKVLGGGVIDKPLTVLANSFSLSAAKMIALTGGKAIKVRTQRDRRAK